MNITLRDVPEDVHAHFKQRAEANGRSLNKELITMLKAESIRVKPNMEELFGRIQKNKEQIDIHISQDEITRMIREDRDGGH